jgi:hypothetical protein
MNNPFQLIAVGRQLPCLNTPKAPDKLSLQSPRSAPPRAPRPWLEFRTPKVTVIVSAAGSLRSVERVGHRLIEIHCDTPPPRGVELFGFEALMGPTLVFIMEWHQIGKYRR